MQTETTEVATIRRLTCCCCGESTRGRQWWNRDTGFGMCESCITFVRERGMSEGEIQRNYGVAGVHHSIEEPLS